MTLTSGSDGWYNSSIVPMSKLLSILFLTFAVGLSAAPPQGKESGNPKAAAAAPGAQSAIERGRYIVEDVAMCELCHTPRDEHGKPDRDRWLLGGAVQLRPTYTARNWAVVAPPIAGDPPGTAAQFIRLLTTGISRTGRPPNPPMPPFRMTRADAEAVLAYLKSLAR